MRTFKNFLIERPETPFKTPAKFQKKILGRDIPFTHKNVTLYHGTTLDAYKNIESQGALIGAPSDDDISTFKGKSKQNTVYFTDQMEIAFKYAFMKSWRYWEEPRDIFKYRKTPLDIAIIQTSSEHLFDDAIGYDDNALEVRGEMDPHLFEYHDKLSKNHFEKVWKFSSRYSMQEFIDYYYYGSNISFDVSIREVLRDTLADNKGKTDFTFLEPSKEDWELLLSKHGLNHGDD